MKTLCLAGLSYVVHSPSVFELKGVPLLIGCNGRTWQIAVHGQYGAREFSTRESAARLVAAAFDESLTA